MNTRATVLRIALLLLVGATIGGILGSIFTGDWIFTIIWPITMTLVFFAVGFTSSTRAAKVVTRFGRVPGIINSRMPQAAVPTEAVLNPPSTAVPSTGAVLNGVPIEGLSESEAKVAQQLAQTPRPQRAWWSRGLAILILLVGVALSLIPGYRLIGWTAGNLAQGRLFDGNDMRTGLHQQEAVDDLARVIGSYDFVSVDFYDSYVIVEALTNPGATTTDQYEWRYGRASRVGPYSGTVDGLFDASQIDFSIVDDLVAASKADTGWSDVTYFYPGVHESDGQVEISVTLGNDYYAASYTYSAAGELLDRYGTGLD